MVETCDERKHPAAREAPIGRLEAEHSAKRGWHADGAVRIGAERKRHHAGRHGRRRSARRPAGHKARIVRIERGAVVDVLARKSIRIFIHIERADEDRARRFEPPDDDRHRQSQVHWPR